MGNSLAMNWKLFFKRCTPGMYTKATGTPVPSFLIVCRHSAGNLTTLDRSDPKSLPCGGLKEYQRRWAEKNKTKEVGTIKLGISSAIRIRRVSVTRRRDLATSSHGAQPSPSRQGSRRAHPFLVWGLTDFLGLRSRFPVEGTSQPHPRTRRWRGFGGQSPRPGRPAGLPP